MQHISISEEENMDQGTYISRLIALLVLQLTKILIPASVYCSVKDLKQFQEGTLQNPVQVIFIFSYGNLCHFL